MTGVEVIGALRADAENHSRNFGYDGVQNEGLTPGVKVDIKRFPENSAVGVPGTASLGCKTGFALYQIDARTWQWQLIENREPANTTTYLVQNEVRPALYVSVIQPYCQAEYGGITQESRAASDRLDKAFPAPLSPSLLASMQVPHRQAAAETPDAAPRRQAAAAKAKTAPKAGARRQASERPRGTVATSMASAAAVEEPQPIRPQRRRIRGISGVSSTESADSPAAFPGAPVFDSETDRQADPVVKTEADLQEDAALADSLNTALPGRHEDDREVAATQEDEEEDEEDEGEEEEQQEDDEEEVAPRQAQVAPPPQEGIVVEQGSMYLWMPRVHRLVRVAMYTRGRQHSLQQHLLVSSISFLPPLDPPGGVVLFLHAPPPLPSGLAAGGSLSDSDGALLPWCLCMVLLVTFMIAGRHWGPGKGTGGLLQKGIAALAPPP